MIKPELLAYTTRGDSIDCLHYGWVCVLDKNKHIVYKKGDIKNFVFLRSALKPIQAIPLTHSANKITQKELAIACASHSGSSSHLKILKSFLAKYKIPLSSLKCGIHHNCSGKHLGMLLVCKKNKWNLNTYLNKAHPLQKLIQKYVRDLAEIKDITFAIDGCGAPTIAIPLINIAIMFSNFTAINNKSYKKIISAMTNYPYIIGGRGQIDSEIIKALNGRLLVKVGAEGIIIAAFNGNSLAVKIADGSPRARSIVLLKLLLKLGWIKKNEVKKSVLRETLKGEIKNHAGKIVGKIISVI